MCPQTSRPNTSTPNRVDGREVPAALHGTVVAHHPRSLLPRHTPPSGSSSSTALGDSVQGQIFELDRAEGSPPLSRRQKDRGTGTTAYEEGSSSGVRQNPKGARPAQGELARFEELSEPTTEEERDHAIFSSGRAARHEVIEFVNVSKSFGDRLLIDDLSFKVPAGAIVGIIGPNGAGKSTLFRLISGKEKADSGTVKIGQTVKMAFVEQSREELENDKTVWQDVSGGLDNLVVGKFTMPSRAYLGKFNFKGNDQQKLVGNLSGGERGRLHLAKTRPSAPTSHARRASNDLDVETCVRRGRAARVAGSVLVISHAAGSSTGSRAHPGRRRRFEVVFFDGTTRNTKPTRRSAWARRAPSPSACVSGPCTETLCRPARLPRTKRPSYHRTLAARRRAGHLHGLDLHFRRSFARPDHGGSRHGRGRAVGLHDPAGSRQRRRDPAHDRGRERRHAAATRRRPGGAASGPASARAPPAGGGRRRCRPAACVRSPTVVKEAKRTDGTLTSGRRTRRSG